MKIIYFSIYDFSVLKMETVAPDNIYDIFMNLDISEIGRMCTVDKKFAHLCEKDRLWELLFRRDFKTYYESNPTLGKTTPGGWKKAFKEQYAAQQRFHRRYPFWYEHRKDAQMNAIFKDGWVRAMERWSSAPDVYHSNKLETIYSLMYSIDPNFQFIDQQKKPIQKPAIINRQLTILTSAGTTVIHGMQSYLREHERIESISLHAKEGTYIRFQF